MTPAPQRKIGSYEIVAPLGAGGMGEVFRARDTKLNRDVALKMLPAAYLQDPDRMARFAREAQVLAALNHPHIAAIYGLEEQTLVMELVEGPTLEEHLQAGALPLDEALAIARQIAEALEYAHEKGVVHRDLKPANVKITPEGIVKVLDFGLAKVATDSTTSTDVMNSPTLTLRATQAGLIMGTAGYMSPEQAAARPVDRRADIWSFGVVLWEMLTGVKLFSGETVSHTLADVLRAEIDPGKLPDSTPPPIRDLIRRCLDRDVKTRLRDIGEARITIQRYLANPSAATPSTVVAAEKPSSRLPWAVAGICALAALAALAWHLREPRPVLQTARFLVGAPEGARFFSPNDNPISPDGRHIAAVVVSGDNSSPELWIRDLDTTTFRRLPGTGTAVHPFWSADSRFISFFSNSKLNRVSVEGGPVQTLCDAPEDRGGTWNRDGVILFVAGPNRVLYRVSAAGGNPVPLWPQADTRFFFPSFLPDGRTFLVGQALRNAPAAGATFVASLDRKEPPRKVLDAGGEVVYAEEGTGHAHLFFRQGDALMAVPFDGKKLAVTGEPFPLLTTAPASSTGKNCVSVSASGRWMSLSDSGVSVEAGESVVLDRNGKTLSTFPTRGQRGWEHLEISPDGTTILGELLTGGTGAQDIWTLDVARGVASRIVPEPGSGPAIWSADGRHILFFAKIGGKNGLYQVSADGSGRPEFLLETTGHHLHASADGKRVVYERTDGGAYSRQILVYSLDQRGAPEVAVQGRGNVGHPQFSPDGKWLAFTSSETGRPELFVQSYPSGSGRWQVTNHGVRQGRWRKDGKEICFSTLNESFMCAAVTPKANGLEFGVPVKIFDAHLASYISSGYFAMSRDAKRFYVNLGSKQQAGRPLTIIENWFAGLNR